MNPAWSVVLFTTLAGAAQGLVVTLALAELAALPMSTPFLSDALAVAVILLVAALVASAFHLGRPARAWRAVLMWRTSWLSREVIVLPAFIGICALWWLALHQAWDLPWLPVAALVFAAALWLCTAMIYASLKPIPAWRHSSVLPAYLGFALLTGGLGGLALLAPHDAPREVAVLALLMLAVAMAVLKRRYWRDIDRGAMPATRASALGLPADRVATVFERPHTEANYLTREMGYVLARKHSTKLRRLALLLFGAVPVLGCAITLLHPGFAPLVLGVAALSAVLGAMVERWLFFAEAKHAVMLYY